MKKLFRILFVFLIFGIISNASAINLDIFSKHAVAYNMNDAEIIYEKNADEITNIASLTKIMTAIVAIENIENLDSVVTIPKSIITSIPYYASVAGFKSGEKVSYRDLLYGLMLPSGADAAEILAYYVAGSTNEFVNLMNKKAIKLELKNTNFANTTGLDAEGNYSTVKEIAKLLTYALKNNDFKKIYTTKTYITTTGLKLEATVLTISKKFDIPIDNILGSKTGSTEKAGLCLSSISTRDNVNLLVVTTNAPYNNSNRTVAIKDANTIYNYFFDNYSYQNILRKKDLLIELNTTYATKDNIAFYAKEDIAKYLPNNTNKNDLVIKYNGINEISYKTPKGTKLGTYTISKDNNVIYATDIILNNILIFSIFKFLKANPKILVLSILIFTVFLILVYLIVKKRIKKRRRRR
ncbi:MAG TPA: serine hydrolase [Bacilli bacterium]|nr:serine hydrolase [Bacilli bacterium]